MYNSLLSRAKKSLEKGASKLKKSMSKGISRSSSKKPSSRKFTAFKAGGAGSSNMMRSRSKRKK